MLKLKAIWYFHAWSIFESSETVRDECVKEEISYDLSWIRDPVDMFGRVLLGYNHRNEILCTLLNVKCIACTTCISMIGKVVLCSTSPTW